MFISFISNTIFFNAITTYIWRAILIPWYLIMCAGTFEFKQGKDSDWKQCNREPFHHWTIKGLPFTSDQPVLLHTKTHGTVSMKNIFIIFYLASLIIMSPIFHIFQGTQIQNLGGPYGVNWNTGYGINQQMMLMFFPQPPQEEDHGWLSNVLSFNILTYVLWIFM